MRIVIASQTYTYGNGQASFTIRLAEGLSKRGHQVMVITPSERMKSYGTWINGVRIEKVAALHLAFIHPSIYLTPFPTPRVKQLLEEFKPDLIHIQDHYFLSGAVMKEAQRRHIYSMGTNHFLPENLLPSLRKFPTLQKLTAIPLWKMMLNVFNQLDVATTPSKTAARILQEQDIQIPVRAISNGVDTQRFRPNHQMDRVGIRRKYNLSPDQPLFLYMGRLDGEKRLDILLEAASLLESRNFQLVIGGYGSSEVVLRKQVQTLGLEGRVVFIGYVSPDDLPSLYNSADIFAMPSPEELQSIATLEAMACGKPILAANARALPELVKSGVNGYLFQTNIASDAARQMERLIQEREKWSEMGLASLERVQEHSLQSTLIHYEEQYKLITEQIWVKQSKTVQRKILQKST